jgi:hypothetical protein
MWEDPDIEGKTSFKASEHHNGLAVLSPQVWRRGRKTRKLFDIIGFISLD